MRSHDVVLRHAARGRRLALRCAGARLRAGGHRAHVPERSGGRAFDDVDERGAAAHRAVAWPAGLDRP